MAITVQDTVNDPVHPFGLPAGSVRGFLSVLICGFFAGLLGRLVLGRTNPFFYTFRAWVSVIAILMLVVELVLFLGVVGGDAGKLNDFLRWWQAVELVFVTAYFGCRS